MQCPVMRYFSTGHYVQEEHVSAGHWLVFAGQCLMSGVYFLACTWPSVSDKYHTNFTEI